MDVQQVAAPSQLKPASKATDKPEAENDRAGQSSAARFSSLLKSWRQEEGAAPDAALLARVGIQDLPPGEVLTTVLSMDELLGQAQRLQGADAEAHTQPENGTSQTNAHGWGAQMHVAIGQPVATVAAGVQTAAQADVTAGTAALAQSTATALLAQGSGVAEAAEQLLAGDALQPAESDGRLAMQGHWILNDGQTDMPAALQRVVAQVEQWAAASVGVKPKPGERATGGSAVAGATEAVGAGTGSGTRVMDNAVREVQQAQDSMFEMQHDAPVEDMRFWLQGRQQRAQVVLENEGQPVRVQVTVRGTEAQVAFQADQAQTRELLERHVVQLREMLQQQGVELADVQVQAQAQGDAASQPEGQRHAWQETPVRYGAVQVPVDEVPAKAWRAQNAQGLDLYA